MLRNVGLCAGLLRLALLLGMRALLPDVACLLAVVSQYLSVGMLVGASIGTAGLAVLFWFRLRAARRPTTDP